MKTSLRRLFAKSCAALLVLSLIAAACGSDGGGDDATGGDGETVQLVAVNGRAYEPELLREAVTAAAQTGSNGVIDLLVRNLDDYRTVRVEYRGGLRYPQLERIPGTVDRLAAVLKPRSAPTPTR